MTRDDCIKIAKSAYVSLWGKKWIKENSEYIGTNEEITKDSSFRLDIEMWKPLNDSSIDDKEMTLSPIVTRPQHTTSFLFNLKSGEYTITEHY